MLSIKNRCKVIRWRTLQVFCQLLMIDLRMLFKDIRESLLDTQIWITLSTFCNGYIFPHLGVGASYGAFLVIGHLVSSGFFLSFYAAVAIADDVDGDKIIGYELMLPLPAWMVLLKKSLAWAAKSMVISFSILPLAKIILQERLDLSFLSPVKFFIAFVLINLFSGMVAIFSASIIKSLLTTGRVWVRFIYPFWYLGGTVFPYKVVCSAFPWIGVLLLFNPVTYATELIRAAILSPDSYKIPFEVSALMLIVFSLIIFYIGFLRLKKRLDFI